jgi:hypothetical protein
MTTIDEAIAHFKYGISHDIFKPPVVDYASMAILALEKSKPKLVIHERSFWHYSHYCPSCNSYLEKEGLKYCPDCAQALDWSTYEMGLKYVR